LGPSSSTMPMRLPNRVMFGLGSRGVCSAGGGLLFSSIRIEENGLHAQPRAAKIIAMLHKIPLALIVVQLFAVLNAPGAQLPSLNDRAGHAFAAAVDRMMNTDPEGAIAVLRPIATTWTNPFDVLRAKCLIGAALVQNGELRSGEEGAAILNHQSGVVAQNAWKQAVPDCVSRLEAALPRLAVEQRAATYYYLGIVGTNESDHLRYLREALKVRPEFPEAEYQLGVHLMALGQFDEAAQHFQRVAEQRPDWSEPHTNMGLALTLSGRPADAIRKFQEAIKIDPESPDAHGQLGLAYYSSGDFDKAMTECARALRGVMDNPLYHNCAAMVLLEKDRPGDALAYARRATQLAPTHETFLVVLAASLLANGQQNEAIETARRAAAAEPRLVSDPSRLERAHLLRNRALALARQLVQKISAPPDSKR